MAKVKKVEKRNAPKKVAKRKPHSSDSYLKLADAIMHPKKSGEPKDAKAEIDSPKGAPPKVKRKNAYIEKMGKPRYPQRVPEKPPEPEPPKVEISVRNIYVSGTGYVPALCFRKPGALHVPCVAGDPVNGIRKFTIQAVQHDKSPIVQHGYGNFAAPYSPERFAEHMRRIAGAAPITPEARALLLPYCPDMPLGPAPAELPAPADAAPSVRSRTQPGNGPRVPSGPARTSGKELIRTLADASGLPPEKIRAKLRAAGMRAPYTDEAACRKALDLNGPTKIPEPRRKKA